MNEYPFPEVLDSSMLGTFKSCPEKFHKEYIKNWKQKDTNVHPHAGGAFAHGLEVARNSFYVEGKNAETSVALGMGALMKKYGNFDCPPDSAKSLERMAGAFEFYFNNYPLSDEDPPVTYAGGKRGIEFNFVHPIDVAHPVTGNPLLYCGRMDAILETHGGTFIVDEKTASSLGPQWSRQWDLRSQFTGYKWGCRESGIRVDGVIVRGVSILKTKYETQQAISYRPDWVVDRWYDQLCSDWIPSMIRMWETNRFPYNLDHSCADFGGCPFRSACQSADETPWLSTYFVRKHWDPVTRIETLL